MSLERISHLTYEVRHNPNCPKPYLIVTCGSRGIIERYHPDNICSYGKTLDEAVTAALADYTADRKRRRDEFEQHLAAQVREAQRRALRWEADRHRNLVWA